MIPEAVLRELLERMAAGQEASASITEDELSRWPNAAVAEMKTQRLLAKARPASSAVCPGCERECTMPVHVLPDAMRVPAAFIVCDKRSDINRVDVPIGRLEQWHTTGELLADVLARLLEVSRTASTAANDREWVVGTLKGRKHKSLVTLRASDGLQLSLAGHAVPLADVLTFDGNTLAVDKGALLRLIDDDAQEPASGVGSPAWRKQKAKAAAHARHSKPGGSREKQDRIRAAWASGKYTTRDICAEQECAALDMSFAAARKALRNQPDPERSA